MTSEEKSETIVIEGVMSDKKCQSCKEVIINALKQITGGKRQLEELLKQ